MARANFPFYFVATAAVEKAVGSQLPAVALAALKAMLRHGKGLEIAHQQINYGDVPLAFSSRVTKSGDLVLDLDLGDPRLASRIILEDDLKRKEKSGVRRGLSRW